MIIIIDTYSDIYNNGGKKKWVIIIMCVLFISYTQYLVILRGVKSKTKSMSIYNSIGIIYTTVCLNC